MREHITINIVENEIVFNYKTISEEELSYVNKNSFYKDTLFYTLKYFKHNLSKISSLLSNKGINTIRILRLVTFEYVNYIINSLKIEHVILDFPSTLALEDYELFLLIDSIKVIDCYYMPNFIEEKFKNKNIKVNLNYKDKVSDRFMLLQDAFDYETLYYKKNLELKENYPNLLKDLEEFLRINYNLKSIHLYIFDKDVILNIIELIKHDESRNIICFLHQGYDSENFISENFKWLKELNQKCKDEYMCEFRIIYSNSFLGKNLFKQLTFNNLKLITIFGVYICVISLVLIKSYEFVETATISKLNSDIVNSTYAANEEIISGENNLTDEGEEDAEKLTEKEIKKRYTFTKTFSALKKINKETVGYLVVKDTKINYPVVHHSDNSYYLNHDFYKRKSSMGWVYLDYRNSTKKLNANNIIYGHNMLNGTMFGSLSNTTKSTWRSNKDNLIITYDTPNASYKFKIFSIYKVNYTTDYLKTKFDSKEDFNKFVKMIRKRSDFKSNEKVEYGDKILTLSTCTGTNNRRLVVHAVLMKEEEKNEKNK